MPCVDASQHLDLFSVESMLKVKRVLELLSAVRIVGKQLQGEAP